MGALTSTVERLDNELFNHGKDGLKTRVTEFIAEYKATEREREHQLNKRDQEIRDDLVKHRAAAERDAQEISNKIGKKNLWTSVAALAVAFAGVCVSILAIVCMFYVSRI